MFWTLPEAAELLRCSQQMIRRRANKAGVPHRAIRLARFKLQRVFLFDDMVRIAQARIGTLGDGSETSRLIARRLYQSGARRDPGIKAMAQRPVRLSPAFRVPNE